VKKLLLNIMSSVFFIIFYRIKKKIFLNNIADAVTAKLQLVKDENYWYRNFRIEKY
jgi:hypothetical protein